MCGSWFEFGLTMDVPVATLSEGQSPCIRTFSDFALYHRVWVFRRDDMLDLIAARLIQLQILLLVRNIAQSVAHRDCITSKSDHPFSLTMHNLPWMDTLHPVLTSQVVR